MDSTTQCDYLVCLIEERNPAALRLLLGPQKVLFGGRGASIIPRLQTRLGGGGPASFPGFKQGWEEGASIIPRLQTRLGGGGPASFPGFKQGWGEGASIIPRLQTRLGGGGPASFPGFKQGWGEGGQHHSQASNKVGGRGLGIYMLQTRLQIMLAPPKKSSYWQIMTFDLHILKWY